MFHNLQKFFGPWLDRAASDPNMIPIFFGLCFVGIGVFFLIKQKRLAHDCTMQANGVVRGVERFRSGKSVGSVNYTTTFMYAVQGIEYIKEVSSNSAVASEGEGLTVFYDPSNPERHYVLEYKQNIREGLRYILFGVAFTAVVMVSGYVSDL